MEKPSEPFLDPEKFVPSLREECDQHPFDYSKVILVAVRVENPDNQPRRLPAQMDRHSLVLTDGKSTCCWEVDSLQALFRGNRQPPVLGDYPEAYEDCFMLLDLHALEVSKIYGERRDAEMKEVYSILRRRPDGRSLGFVHDYMWQAAALVLGTRPLSQAEFEAIMARLERSCRTFEDGPASRNYVAALHATFDRKSRPV